MSGRFGKELFQSGRLSLELFQRGNFGLELFQRGAFGQVVIMPIDAPPPPEGAIMPHFYLLGIF